MRFKTTLVILCIYPFVLGAAPQLPEINDQYEPSKKPEYHINVSKSHSGSDEMETTTNKRIEEVHEVKPLRIQVLGLLTAPIWRLISDPKVMMVMKNIGTCIVNGVMEIISYYIPAPLMPLIATVAGMLIPFEPVVTLRRRMPVTSYRRAIKTAVNGFLNTFDAYKVDEFDDDPYMTRRFNRRFLRGSGEKQKGIK